MHFSDQDLVQLLENSRRNNTAKGITGFMLYKNGRFMQLLEGPTDAVSALMDKIRLDPRHEDIKILMEWEASRRTFSDWSMGFRVLSADNTRDVPGFVDYYNLAFTCTRFMANPEKALEFMRAASEVA